MNKIVKEILEKVESLGYKAYIVGGYTRDFLLKKESNDYDICTSAPIKEVFKIIPGKINLDSSLNIKINEINIDITTFRLESDYENRKPHITYTNDLILDLQRRDFTINAICMNKDGYILDELKGINDLQNKIIRVIGNTDKKIKEDPLRILRAIRFSTVLDFTLDSDLEKAISKYNYLVNNLSTYRIKEELDKILISPYYQKGLNYLEKYNLLPYLGIKYNQINYTNDLCGMWSQIETTKNFPFTKTEKNNILKINEIVKYHQIDNYILYKYGLYLTLVAADILNISRDQVKEIYKKLPLYNQKDLAISFLEIKDLLNVEPIKVRQVEDLIIQEILNNNITNDYVSIKRFILENKVKINE